MSPPFAKREKTVRGTRLATLLSSGTQGLPDRAPEIKGRREVTLALFNWLCRIPKRSHGEAAAGIEQQDSEE
jgi:hypothetical protein